MKYDTYLAPYDKYRSLKKPEQYLKNEIILEK